jgi:hypothetical protein
LLKPGSHIKVAHSSFVSPEALPGPDGPVIEMQTKKQLEKQTLDFIENR